MPAVVRIAPGLALAALLVASQEAGAHPFEETAQGEPRAGELTPTVAAFGGAPLSDYSDLLNFGFGGLVGLSYGVHDAIDLTGRVGFYYFLPESDAVTAYQIPFWFGGRIFLAGRGQGIFLSGELAVNVFDLEVDTDADGGSETETQFGLNAGAGIVLGYFTLEAGVYTRALDEIGDTTMAGGSVSLHF